MLSLLPTFARAVWLDSFCRENVEIRLSHHQFPRNFSRRPDCRRHVPSWGRPGDTKLLTSTLTPPLFHAGECWIAVASNFERLPPDQARLLPLGRLAGLRSPAPASKKNAGLGGGQSPSTSPKYGTAGTAGSRPTKTYVRHSGPGETYARTARTGRRVTRGPPGPPHLVDGPPRHPPRPGRR